MKLTAFGIATIFAALGVAGTTRAQNCPCGETVAGTTVNSTMVGSPIVGGVVTSIPSAAPGVVTGYGQQGGVYPYSYWVAPPGQAREYVPYSASGTEPFPFYGRAYGSPGDRWSWYYMGGGDNRYLARYYYQLLR